MRDDPSYADVILDACSVDPLFWINGFVWVHDTRVVVDGRDPTIPFVLYDYQQRAAAQLINAVGRHDMRIKKSRDMGASWLCLAILDWFFIFRSGVHIGAISRNRDYVDKTGEPKSLFWKLDHIHANLPSWMKPRLNRNHMLIENEDNQSAWAGEATTGKIFRGARPLAILVDEFAAFDLNDGFRALYASQAASPCRLFNSTPDGIGNAYHHVCTRTEMEELVFHWSEHPLKRPGLYTSTNGNVRLLDKPFWESMLGGPIEGENPPEQLRQQYKFVTDGKVRSPWYDNECKRTPIQSLIAQELDMDFLGSGSPYFNREVVENHKAQFAISPAAIGEFIYDPFTGQPAEIAFAESDTGLGRFCLWLPLAGRRPPVAGRYVIGADVSQGTGAKSSSSVACVYCKYSGEKVARFKANDLSAEDFGAAAVAIARWFNNAQLCWERNGPGRSFQVRACGDLKYANVYYARTRHNTRAVQTEKEPGWGSTREKKRELFAEYQIALAHARIINRSAEGLDECLQFVQNASGGIEHSAAISATDPRNSGEDHGDEAIADAIATLVLNSTRVRREQEHPVAEYGSDAWFREEAERQKVRQEEGRREWAKNLGWDPLEERRTRNACYA